jgi:hypothetical protein
LTNRVTNAVELITNGRIALRTEGESEQGRIDFHKGVKDAISIFTEILSSDDIYSMLLCENMFLAQELDKANPREKKARESYEVALIEYDDAFYCYETIQNQEEYKKLDMGISHGDKYRVKGMPKDGFMVAVSSHPTRLENSLRMLGTDPDEQTLRELRIRVCKKLKDLYLEKQQVILA